MTIKNHRKEGMCNSAYLNSKGMQKTIAFWTLFQRSWASILCTFGVRLQVPIGWASALRLPAASFHSGQPPLQCPGLGQRWSLNHTVSLPVGRMSGLRLLQGRCVQRRYRYGPLHDRRSRGCDKGMNYCYSSLRIQEGRAILLC